MPTAVLHSRALSGFDAPPVAVEVHLAGGLPAFNLVGLPETEVKESRDRVRAALQNANFEFPCSREGTYGIYGSRKSHQTPALRASSFLSSAKSTGFRR